MSQPTVLTYAAALAILKAPRFADPESIRARDLVAAVERVVELLADAPVCQECQGKGRVGKSDPDPCEPCDGSGAEHDWESWLHGNGDPVHDLWATLPPDARQEALRRARANRQAQSGGTRP